MKKLLSTIMALVMLLSLVPMAVATEGVELTEANSEAQINGLYYKTLDDAVSKVDNGDTIKLVNDVTVSSPVVIPAGKEFTLDLGGKKLTNSGTAILNNGTLTVDNGTIVSTKNVGICAGDNSKTTIQPGVTIEGQEGAVITGYATGATITINGGNFSAKDNAVIAGNGNKTNENKEGKPVRVNANTITINGGTFTGNIESKGYIACGIYAPWKDVITVNGGTFTVNNGIGVVCRAGQVHINGGTFICNGSAKGKVGDKNFDMDAAQALYFDDSNPSYPAYNKNNDGIFVKSGAFTDLASAVKYATDGATITLAEDVALDKAISIGSSEGKTIVLDLGGKTLKGNIDFYAGDLTIQNGTIDGRVYANATNVDMEYGHLTIAKDAVIKGGFDRNGNSNAVLLWQAEVSANNYGATVDIYGTLEKNLWVIGNIKTDLTTAENPCVVNIHDGAVIKGEGGTGVAVQGAAKVTVGKAAITGSTGIEVRAGELTVDGATVVGTAKPTTITPNGNGTTTDGAGIAVAQHTTKLPIKVTINSGDISGYSALYQSNPQKNDAEFVEKVSVAVNGGTFKAINGGTCGVYSENNCVAVTGGTFSSNPSAFVADKSLEVSKDTAGQYTVSKKTNAAETSEVKLPAARTEGTTEAKIDKGDIDTGKDLTVSSEVASVTINQKGVEAIGNNSDLTLTVKTVDQPNDANKAAYDEAIKGNDTASAIVVDIKLSAGSGNAFTQAVEGAYALVTVKYDASGKADKLKVFYLNGSVKQELTKVNDAANGAVNTFSYDDTNKEITMKLPHFSQYLITTTATTSGGNTSGGSSVIKTGAGSSAASTTQTVTTDLTPGSITKVTVDGKVVDAKYYTVSGSNVTFTAEFLKTLKNGSHTVTVENATKIAKGVFTVNNPTTAVQAPTTADAGIALYAGMAIASVMGTGVVFTSRKRKNH